MSAFMDPDAFEEAVADAMDTIPQDLLDRLDNVAILIEEQPTAEQMPAQGTLLGLYVGIPLPQRMDSYGYGSVPDRIYIFRRPLMRISRDRADLVRQIRVTVLHEIGHYFGISDERLHELGWA